MTPALDAERLLRESAWLLRPARSLVHESSTRPR
jgi:hypothetical protein